MTSWGSRWYEMVGWALFSLHGRIQRHTFAFGSVLLVAVLWSVIAQIVYAEEESGRQVFWSLLLIIGAAMSLWCLFALGVKRLHDVGRSGVFAVILLVPPLWPVSIIVLAVWQGEQGDNQYGPPPVARS